MKGRPQNMSPILRLIIDLIVGAVIFFPMLFGACYLVFDQDTHYCKQQTLSLIMVSLSLCVPYIVFYYFASKKETVGDQGGDRDDG